MTYVTRTSLATLLAREDEQFVVRVVGRAMVALFNRQLDSEKYSNTAAVDNGAGFSGADARSGSLTAKYFLKHGTLLSWQIERWTKPARNGMPRLCKYAKQLNEIAAAKAKSA